MFVILKTVVLVIVFIILVMQFCNIIYKNLPEREKKIMSHKTQFFIGLIVYLIGKFFVEGFQSEEISNGMIFAGISLIIVDLLQYWTISSPEFKFFVLTGIFIWLLLKL